MHKLFRAAVPLALLLNVALTGVVGAQDASGGGANPGAGNAPVASPGGGGPGGPAGGPEATAGETARRGAPDAAPASAPSASGGEAVLGVSERQSVESLVLPRTGGPGPLMLAEIALGGLGLAALGRRLRRR